MEKLWQDVRYAMRTLTRAPGFALVAVLSLALGIGANTAIFTLVDAVLLRTLPVEAPEELVAVGARRVDRVAHDFSYAAYEAYRDRAEVFSGVLAHSTIDLALSSADGAERVAGEVVSANYFDVLGVGPVLGRTFIDEEAVGRGTEPVVVLSQGLWQRRFGSDPAVLGQTVTLNGKPFSVIGVAPERFLGLMRGEPAELWVPLSARPRLDPGFEFLTGSGPSWLNVIGRLRPDLSLEQAQAGLSGFDRWFVEAGLKFGALGTVLEPADGGLTYRFGDVHTPLLVLLGAVGFVLLIACANVANLLLARAAARRKEIAIRLSLGSGRPRLVRQLLTESLLLALVGGTVGLLVALWATDLFAAFRPPTNVAVVLDLGPDARILGFTLLLSLATGLLFGLAPAVRATRTELVSALKGTATTRGCSRLGARGALVVAQVALSLVLVIGAGLFARSLRNLAAVDVGFDDRQVLLASVDLDAGGYEGEEGQRFLERLLAGVRGLPGVESATLATTVTPNPGGRNFGGMRLEGYTPAPEEDIGFDQNSVGLDYFETLRIPILLGRGFDERDAAGARPVAVINETMAERYWPGESPIGKLIYADPAGGEPHWEIVGVAKDGKYRDLRESPTNNVFMPLAQQPSSRATLLVRATGDPLALAGPIRRELQALDARLPLFDVRTLREHVGVALMQDRVVAVLTSLFGVLALVIAAVGLYGVVSYLVVQRTREIGVRMALGARRADVLRLVLRGAMLLAGLGLLTGVPAALAATRLFEGLLYGVSAMDAATFASGALVMLCVALAAAYLPARRATRVDPMVALRAE